MAKNHAIFNGTHCAFWDVDAYNLVGIAATDIDNATFLTLGDIKLKDSTGGYEFTVIAAAAGDTGDLIAGTPAVGYGVEAQIFDDPRYFTNEAGKPISVKRLVKGDAIEVDLTAFTADPTTSTYAKVGANGKITGSTTTSDPFKILGTHTIDIGGELVKTWILMKQ
jgi:hypothetical protein